MRTLVLIGVAMISTAAAGEDLNYTFINFGYQDINADLGFFDADGDGYVLAGSLAATDNLHLFATYSNAEFKLSLSNIDLSELSAGLGFNKGLSPSVDFVAQAALIRAESKTSAFSSFKTSDNGYGVNLALRGMAAKKLELSGTLSHVNVFSRSETGLTLSGVYYPVPGWGLGASYDYTDDVRGVSLGFRFNIK